MKPVVYRCYDEKGQLLYIGYSGDIVERLRQHRTGTPWFEDVDRIDLEWCSNRTAAYRAEQRAILAESPLHNVRECLIPLDDHDSIIKRLEGDPFLTYTEVAEEYGVSRERVRQIVPTDLATQRKRARHEARLWETLIARMQRALVRNQHCNVCGSWILRKSKLTCSPECAKAYLTLRDVDDPDERRRNQAKVFLARPDHYSNVNLEWARRMLGPNPPPRNREYLIPGSERAEVIKKYRPERYAELIGDSA